MFFVGMLAGAGIAVMIIGFLAVVAEDHEQEQARQKNMEAWRWYAEEDGK